MQQIDTNTIHRAFGAGRWFPGQPAALQRMVDGYIGAAEVPEIKGRIVAAIAPHAGYVYSGAVAGCTYRALRDNAAREGKPDAVVVLGFAHRGTGRGVALLNGRALRTPLGDAVLDTALAAGLAAADSRIRLDPRPHRGEHSAENQVPFLQAALPDTPLVIAILEDHSPATLKALQEALAAAAADRRLVVVASTDLLHDPDYDRVTATDRRTLDLMRTLDDTGLATRWTPREQVCCGIGAVLTAMRHAAGRGCREGVVLHYRNSGDDHPESRGQWVVGYGSIAYAVH